METACLANYSGAKELPQCTKETFTGTHTHEEEKTTTGVGDRERYLAEKDSFQKSIFLHEARKKKNVLSRYPPPLSLEVRKLTPERSHTHGFLFKARKEGEGRKSFHVLVGGTHPVTGETMAVVLVSTAAAEVPINFHGYTLLLPAHQPPGERVSF